MEFRNGLGRPATAAWACECVPIRRQVARVDERAEYSLTPACLDAEQPGGLGQREPESRHFLKLRLNPCAQIMFLAGFETRDVRTLFRESVHGLTPGK